MLFRIFFACIATAVVIATPLEPFENDHVRRSADSISYTARYDDVNILPGSGIASLDQYEYLIYQGFNIEQRGLNGVVSVGLKTESPPASISYDQLNGVENGPPIISINGSAASFTFRSFFYGCTIGAKETLAQKTQSCKITITGYRGSKMVATQTFTFTANTDLTQDMVLAKVSKKFKKLTSVAFSTVGTGTTVLPASIFDNLSYKVYFPSSSLARRTTDPDLYNADYDDLKALPASGTKIATYDRLDYQGFMVEQRGVDGVVVAGPIPQSGSNTASYGPSEQLTGPPPAILANDTIQSLTPKSFYYACVLGGIKETAASELASCIITVEGFRGKHRVAKQSFTFTAKGGLTQVMTQGVFNAEFAKVTKLKFSTTGVGKIVSPASIFDNFEYEVFYPSKQLQRRADPDTYDATYDDLDLVPGAQLTNVGTYDDLTYRKFGAEPHGVDGVVVSGVVPHTMPNTISYSKLKGGRSAIFAKGLVESFTLKSVYYGCDLATKETAASHPESCTITAFGFRGKTRVAKQSFTYTATGSLTQDMALAEFSEAFQDLTKVTFKTVTRKQLVRRKANQVTYDAKYDDLTPMTGTSVGTIKKYDDLVYRGFDLASRGVDGINIVGLVPKSKPNIVSYGPIGALTNPSPALLAKGHVQSFTLHSFYYGCQLSTKETAAAPVESCSITVQGFKGKKVVATQIFKFKATGGLTQKMKLGKFNRKFKGLTKATFITTSASVAQPLPGTLIDNLSYTVYLDS